MKLGSIAHKGLRRLLERGDRSGLPPAFADKIEDMVAFLQAMGAEDELRVLTFWRPHQLSGDRAGDWSLTVSRNWRLTFRIDPDAGEIFNLDLEDYH